MCKHPIDVSHKHQPEAQDEGQAMEKGTGIEAPRETDKRALWMEGSKQKQHIDKQGQGKADKQRRSTDRCRLAPPHILQAGIRRDSHHNDNNVIVGEQLGHVDEQPPESIVGQNAVDRLSHSRENP